MITSATPSVCQPGAVVRHTGDLMDALIERIEMAGYHAGRTAHSTTTTIYRNSRWTQTQADAYRKQFREGMAYSVVKGECRINPDGWIKSRGEALDILGLAVAEEYLSE